MKILITPAAWREVVEGCDLWTADKAFYEALKSRFDPREMEVSKMSAPSKAHIIQLVTHNGW